MFMAATINATPGAADANSYITLAAALVFADSIIDSVEWYTATTDVKTRALITATRTLDLLKYVGTRSTTTQALAWPRKDYATSEKTYTDTEIPNEIKQAQFEIALSLVQNSVSAGGGSTSIIPGINNADLQRVKLDVIEIEWKRQLGSTSPAKLISPGLLNDLVLNTPGSTIAVVRS